MNADEAADVSERYAETARLRTLLDSAAVELSRLLQFAEGITKALTWLDIEHGQYDEGRARAVLTEIEAVLDTKGKP